jgi:tRNA A-37 threonylcarbamoyl transferase component Bud32
MVFRASGRLWRARTREVFVKTQRGYLCHPAYRLWLPTPTLSREVRALRACRAFGLDVPRVVFFREAQGTAELVTEAIDGALDLDHALTRPTADRERIIGNCARSIGLLHRNGWVHGALGSEHILVQPHAGERVWLIDFEKARRSRSRTCGDLERLWRHVQCVTEQESALFLECYRRTLRARPEPAPAA